jgi:hypothetical protein
MNPEGHTAEDALFSMNKRVDRGLRKRIGTYLIIQDASLSEKPECRHNGAWLQRLKACRCNGRLS